MTQQENTNIPNSNNANNSNEIDLRKVCRDVLSHWYWFLIGVVVCCAFGVLYIVRTTPRYTTSGSIMLRQKGDESLAGQVESLSMLGLGNNGAASDEVVVLQSRDLMYQALDALDLWNTYYAKDGMRWVGEYPTHTFTVMPVEITKKALKRGGYIVTIEPQKEGYKVKVKQGKFHHSTTKVADLSKPIETCVGTIQITQNRPIPEDKTAFRTTCLPKPAIVDMYRSQVNIALQKKESNIINLTKTSDIPSLDVALLSKIIEQYNLNTIVDKNIIATNTAAFIDERLNVITRELSDAEDAVAEYKAKNNLTDLSEEAKIFLQANSDEQKELANVETQINLVNYIEEFIQDDTKRFSLIPANIGVTDPSLTASISEYNTLLLQRMRVLRTATDSNPVVEQLNEQLISMRQNIAASIASVRESLTITRSGLQQRDNQFSARIKSVPVQERQYVQIKRQQALKEEIYLFLYQKREENALMLAATATPAKIIDTPKVDTATGSPKRRTVILFCILLGLAVPAGILYIWSLFNNKIADPKEYEKLVNAPFAGQIVENSRGKHIAIHEGESTVSAELFRLVRTNLRFMLPADIQHPVILVTSCVNGEGKSYVATNTALSLALLGKKVVLVGLDIRKPMLATYFGLSNKGCLTSYLSDDEYSIDDTIQHGVEHPNLDIIPAGVIPPNPSELLQNDRLDALFAELRNRYDYVIVDSAPVAMVSDTFLLDRVADMTLFVSRANYTPREMVDFINQVVAQKRMKNVVCLFNGVKNAKAGYGYGYGYGYGNSKK